VPLLPRHLLVCRAAGWWLLPAAAVLSTCAFPTDDSDQVIVTLEAPRVAVRGQTVLARARAWHRTAAGVGLELARVSLVFSSDNEAVATVEGKDEESAIVTAVNSGRARISAVAADYEHSEAGEIELRVTNTVEIDSVRPDTVRYGEQVSIYGVGFGQVSRVSLGEVNLIPDSAGFSGDGVGEGQQRFWIPYPATTGRILAVANEGFSAPAGRSTTVLPISTYATGDGSPALIDLNGPSLLGAKVLFHNPALAATRSEDGGVFFRFVRTDSARAITFVVSTSLPVVKNLQPYISVATGNASGPLEGGVDWSIGTARQFCRTTELITAGGLDFGSNPATVVRAFQEMPSHAMEIFVLGESPGRFAITVLDGYLTGDPRITPDQFEDNDYCTAADHPSKRVDLSQPLAENLTIHNPYEVDWLRLTVPADSPEPRLLTIRTASRPFGAADSSDLALHIARTDFRDVEGNPVGWAAEADSEGSDEILTLEIEPGDYYLAVSDNRGVATRYAICAAFGNSCTLPALPSTAVAPAQRSVELP
jgi:hypothetical protein